MKMDVNTAAPQLALSVEHLRALSYHMLLQSLLWSMLDNAQKTNNHLCKGEAIPLHELMVTAQRGCKRSVVEMSEKLETCV